MHVVQDQHHGRGHRRESRPQPGDDRAGHRTHRGGQRVEHPLIDRLDRIERFRDIAEQDLRVVVCLVDRHPREGLAVTLGPLRQQRRLAVAAGATTETIGRGSPRARRSIRDERRTVPGRISGRQSLDATRSNAGPPARRDRPSAHAPRSRLRPQDPPRSTTRRRCAPAGASNKSPAGFGAARGAFRMLQRQPEAGKARGTAAAWVRSRDDPDGDGHHVTDELEHADVAALPADPQRCGPAGTAGAPGKSRPH